MAKRNTDTEKWKKQFFKRLTQSQMLFWMYINDDCDHSGVWYVDLDVASMRIKDEIDLKAMIQAFNQDEERVILFHNGKKLLIKPYVLFQYGETPNPRNRLHLAAEKTLKGHGFGWFNGVITLLERPKEVCIKDYVGLGDRGVEEGDFDQLSSFEEIWGEYPARGRLKRSASLRLWCEIAPNRDIAARVRKSIKNYAGHLKANDWKMPLELPNFLASWDDWENHIEPKKEETREERDARLLDEIKSAK